MANNCLNCKYIKEEEWDDPCYMCEEFSHWELKPKQTNADRIREMSDEELVQYIGHDLRPCPPPYYENHFKGCMVDDTSEELITNKECDECWLEWMKSEVNDG